MSLNPYLSFRTHKGHRMGMVRLVREHLALDLLPCPRKPFAGKTDGSIAPKEDLYSCGGCATLGIGTDCTAIPSVLSVSCERSSCTGMFFLFGLTTCQRLTNSTLLQARLPPLCGWQSLSPQPGSTITSLLHCSGSMRLAVRHSRTSPS